MRLSGLYSGLVGNVYSLSSDQWIDTLDADLNSLVLSNQQDAVVSIIMFPNAYINVDIDDDGTPIVADAPRQHTQVVVAPNKIGNYTPRNKKLLTFPYCFMTVDTISDSKNYKYEYFEDRSNIRFAEIGCISPNPEILVMPIQYNGSNTDVINATESVVCSGFPQCAFVIDSYRAWIAQKSVDYQLSQQQYVVRDIASATTAMQSAFMGNVVGAITGGAGTADLILQQGRDTNAAMIEATAGSKVRGNCGGSSNVASRSMGIYYKYMSITEQFAKIIDDFFDRFGYSSGRIKIPNRNVRPHWTYTKTVDVAIRGNVPVDDMRKIKSIYNAGITFWKYGSEVGNYSLNNSV